MDKQLQGYLSCRIEIDDPHISTYASEYRGKKEVKVNVRSICNVLQTRVQLTVKIYKTTFFGNRLVAQSTTNPADPKSNGRTVLNYGTSNFMPHQDFASSVISHVEECGLTLGVVLY